MTRNQLHARQAYREAWSAYCLTKDPKKKRELEECMDALQPQIAPGPNEEWMAFARSLPGFLAFWNRWHEEVTESHGA